jgi:hypothetical protein
MDLKDYYKSIRDQAELIPTEDAVVVSKARSNGGKEGIMSEVPRRTAAQLIIDGDARLATAEESESYHAEMQERRQKAQDRSLSQKVQVAVVSESDMQAFRNSKRGPKA